MVMIVMEWLELVWSGQESSWLVWNSAGERGASPGLLQWIWEGLTGPW